MCGELRTRCAQRASSLPPRAPSEVGLGGGLAREAILRAPCAWPAPVGAPERAHERPVLRWRAPLRAPAQRSLVTKCQRAPDGGESRVRIVPGDLDDAQVLGLLRLHLAGMHAASPPGSVYALDLSGLRAPEIAFFTAWDGAALVGIGALKALDAASGEIKSMRTHPDHLRRGVAARLLEHLLALARARGYRRVSLETGTGPEFAAADALYRRYGFANGERFGDYAASDFNQFLHLEL